MYQGRTLKAQDSIHSRSAIGYNFSFPRILAFSKRKRKWGGHSIKKGLNEDGVCIYEYVGLGNCKDLILLDSKMNAEFVFVPSPTSEEFSPNFLASIVNWPIHSQPSNEKGAEDTEER